jgi:hypothetical protein
MVEVEDAKRTRLGRVIGAIPRGAQRPNGFARRQRRGSNPEAALVAAQPRDNVRHQRRDELIAVAVEVAGVHTERDLIDPAQPATRDMGEVRHGQRRTSLVLVMRTQAQPVSLQTRSSPDPGAP